MSGSGISWAICKTAPRFRQITTPAPHHSVFYRPDALPAAQPTASKHWRHTHTDARQCYVNRCMNCGSSNRPVWQLLKHRRNRQSWQTWTQSCSSAASRLWWSMFEVLLTVAKCDSLDPSYRTDPTMSNCHKSCAWMTHTHTRLTALCPGISGWATTRKVKPIWILLKQQTVSDSGITKRLVTLLNL